VVANPWHRTTRELDMTIPTQTSLVGFIASVPQLHFTGTGVARFYARVGVEHARKEPDGTYTALDPTFHDLVLYRASAERAYARFRKGDSFVASGYTHEYQVDQHGNSVERAEFVARRIGHDTARTNYDVHRRQNDPLEFAAPTATPNAVGM
jgi:single-strand DNA-binding protein